MRTCNSFCFYFLDFWTLWTDSGLKLYIPLHCIAGVTWCAVFSAASRSLQMALSSKLLNHLHVSFEAMRLPSPSLLYDMRITLDLVTMLYARETIFSKSSDRQTPWVLHLRCDASPQFGRDFLVTQADIVWYGSTHKDTRIQKRLLPIQCIGSRAASAGQKLEKLVHTLTLESERVPQLQARGFCFDLILHLTFDP